MSPPLVCLKYERIPQQIAVSVPEDWGLGKSQRGWMTGEEFYKFITNVIHPWLLINGIPHPIFFSEGCVSHLTLHTSQFCDKHGIVLIALLPNSTHVLQPMDLAVYLPLKNGWKNVVHEWQVEQVATKLTQFWAIVGQDFEVPYTSKESAGEVLKYQNSFATLKSFLGVDKTKEFNVAGDIWNGDEKEEKHFQHWPFFM
ncbi:hypothetical protein PR048_012359 [Dryococelus australis]|uniref:DDE-1 domain-containing protein n=1 Tax=Dryococelus australis TaxID=614101 RepID=A0ABQ9HPP1_9NEOP|nr:hypothetical protein PR048_012359 [Dryococelus australis]